MAGGERPITRQQCERWYLGVDGGGSKTLAVVVDAEGVERGRGAAGSSNYQAVGLDAAVGELRWAAEAATSAAGCALPLAGVWLGLAGLDSPGDFDALLPHVRHLAANVRLTNDAELVLSGLEEHAGVALVAGTGAIALGRDAEGRIARASGWGHVLGDEGSGYDLGRAGLRAALRAADGRGRMTALLTAILEAWELREPEQILRRVYPETDKAQIARLAPLVLRRAQEGDVVASAIARRGAEELALAACAVSRALGRAGAPLALALGGGLLVHDAYYRTEVLRRVMRRQSLGSVAIVAEPALSAARATARHGASGSSGTSGTSVSEDARRGGEWP